MKFLWARSIAALLLLLPVSTLRATHVVMEAGPFLGVVLSVAVDPIHPETIYAVAYNGGVFRSEDRGASWVALTHGLPNRKAFSLLIDPQVPHRLYLGTDEGIFYSTCKGSSWSLLALKGRNVRSLAVDPKDPTLLYGATDQGVFRGQGKEWTRISEGLRSDDIRTILISTEGELFAGTFDGVFKREKNASSWSAVNNGLADKAIRALAADPITANTLYAGTAYSGVFKTTNGGKRWKPVNAGLLNSTVLSLIMTPPPHKALYAGTIDGVFKSVDGGRNWFPTGQELPFTVASLAFDSKDPRVLYAGSGGRVFKSATGGEKWQEVSYRINYFGTRSVSQKPESGSPISK